MLTSITAPPRDSIFLSCLRGPLKCPRIPKVSPHWRQFVAPATKCRRDTATIAGATNCHRRRRQMSPVWASYDRTKYYQSFIYYALSKYQTCYILLQHVYRVLYFSRMFCLFSPFIVSFLLLLISLLPYFAYLATYTQ